MNKSRKKGIDEFTGYRALLVVAPDYCIKANLGEEEEKEKDG